MAANTIICKESYFWVTACGNIINVQREQNWTKNSPLWDTRQDWRQIKAADFYEGVFAQVTEFWKNGHTRESDDNYCEELACVAEANIVTKIG